MRIIRQARELQAAGRKTCLAIGMFDGVHLGHQQVIKQAISDARQHQGIAVAITFDRHPNAIVAPDRAPPLIYSLPQKLREIASLGIDATWLIEFTLEFSRQTGEQFVRSLLELGPIYSICVGNDFTFGHRRAGNVDLLRKLGKELNFHVHGLAAVSLGGEVVSSTRIRECIAAGDLDAASQMLGRTYCLAGVVRAGDQLGRKLGFPTANLDVRGLLTPPRGVYAAVAKTPRGSFLAAVNIGIRPTVDPAAPEPRVEAHLLEFEGELYGSEIELCLSEYLRPEKQFADLAALREQIARDVQAVRELLA